MQHFPQPGEEIGPGSALCALPTSKDEDRALLVHPVTLRASHRYSTVHMLGSGGLPAAPHHSMSSL